MARISLFTLLTILMGVIVSFAYAELVDGIVVYFTFDDVSGKTIRDSSGNGLDANIVANTELVEGKYGDAIKITAEGPDCVNVPADEKLKISGEITLAAWIYMEAWNTNGQWFDKNCHNGGEHTSYGIGAFDNGVNYNMFFGSDANRQTFSSPNELDANTWNYVVGTYDGNSIKIYVDGDLAAEEAKSFNFTGTNDQDLRIGCSKDRPQYTFDNGMIDEAAIWSRALSQDEIKLAMNGEVLAVSAKNRAVTTWGMIKQRLATH